MACRIRLAGLVMIMLLVGCARRGVGGVSGSSLRSEPGVRGGEELYSPRVRVMTYNVNWGAAGIEQTLGVILGSGADVVCLQEITEVWERRLRAQLSGDYPHMLFRLHLFPSGGMAVLSRWPVVESAYVQPLGGWFPAWVLRAQTPVGQMQVVAVHLYPPVPDREGARHVRAIHLQEIKSLLVHVERDRPTVFVGDFNESCQDLAVGYLLENGYTDALRACEQANAAQSPTARRVRDSVDHILYSSEFECHSADMLDRGGSDHPPVVAVLGRRGESDE